jgi:hypothetical protein
LNDPEDLMSPIDEIKRLYFQTTKATVARDLARAVDLLKTLQTEEERERAAVYMDGLSQMRSEWGVRGGSLARPKPGPSRKPGVERARPK